MSVFVASAARALLRADDAAASAAPRGGRAPRASVTAVAAIDLILATDGRLFVLELNDSPALAPPHLCDARFRAHVVRFVGDTLALALSGGRERGGFTCARDLLDDDDGARSRATE